MTDYGTGFVESEAVLALTAEDYDTAIAKLRTMSDGELRQFYVTIERLSTMIISEQNRRAYLAEVR